MSSAVKGDQYAL